MLATTPAPDRAVAARQRALRKAFALGLAGDVVRLRLGLYEVPSQTRPGQAHRVTVSASGVYHCSCEAGVAGRPCVHQAAVYLRKLEQNSRANVVFVRPPSGA